MRDFEYKFKSGEYIHEFNGYSPFYLGCMGSGTNLGSEEPFLDLHGFNCGIGDVVWWDKTKLDNLRQEDINMLLMLLYRNKKLAEYIDEKCDKFSKSLGIDSFLIYRLGNKKILDLINTINELRGDCSLAAYIVDNNIKFYNISESINESVESYKHDIKRQQEYASWKEKEDSELPELNHFEIFGGF
jgi:hypothetical protein